jgi:hypothetical protein
MNANDRFEVDRLMLYIASLRGCGFFNFSHGPMPKEKDLRASKMAKSQQSHTLSG